ncbi:MAG: methylated-DNA--[protein]-cysteine S-methyltransferase [Rhodocyclaceae bacterium]|nr:methylated-DNA--[protein]-cysteine S-methyltransferase [Rhodocyclaceae bacterium]MBX3670669.1 methylated-DNA--[protein]-cysteine S-methyltransferase [Rhodocyclaceae bacterium]
MDCSANPESAGTVSAHYAAIVAAPGFCLGVETRGEYIVEIRFLPPQTEQAPADPLARRAVAQLQAWLSDADFAFDLPLAPAGTAFQRRVWAAIAAIPRGSTASYGDLARQLGSAARAVGGACRSNPYPVVIPCHRVVAQARTFNGGLGGFAGETGGLLLDIKRWLLRHEAAQRGRVPA